MALTEELQNKHKIATQALDRLNRRLLRGGSALQQKKNANRLREQLEKLKNLNEQLRRSSQRV